MTPKLITPPASEPITLNEAKAFARVEHNSEDTTIANLIKAAREQAEAYQQRQLMTATYRLVQDEFCDREIRIPLPPLQSAVVKYYDTSGTLQTLDSSNYHVDADSTPGRIVLADGKSWPETQRDRPSAVRIEFVAGYASAGVVPEKTKQAILLAVTCFYCNRGDSSVELPQAFFHLLDAERWRV